LKCLLNDGGSVGGIVFGRKARISANVFNPRAFDYSWGSGRQGQAEEGGNQGYGDSFPLDLLCYRRTATIAGTSGSNHHNGIDI
jgi:hypothetical protein